MKSLFELAIKVLSAYLVLSNSGHVVNLFMWYPDISNGELNIVSFAIWGYLIVPLIVGCSLWFLAPRIAKTLALSDASPISEQGLVSAGSFLIGMYWALHSIGIVLGSYQAQQSINWGYVLVFVISLTLLLGHKFIAYLYKRLKNVG